MIFSIEYLTFQNTSFPKNLIWYTASLLMLSTALVILAAIDHVRNILPDAITLPMLGLGLLVNYYISAYATFPDAVIGCVAGYVSIRIIHDFEVLTKGYSGIGLGDAKMFAALGAWFGWRALPFIVVVAAIVMLTVYFKREEKPFGVGLAMAATGFGLTNLFVLGTY